MCRDSSRLVLIAKKYDLNVRPLQADFPIKSKQALTFASRFPAQEATGIYRQP